MPMPVICCCWQCVGSSWTEGARINQAYSLFMPVRAWKAPADAERVSVAEWRRDPAKPATLLKGSTFPAPRPAKPYPLPATKVVGGAIGVATTRRSRGRGVSPRYAPSGAYERFTMNVTRLHSTPLLTLVTTSILKRCCSGPPGRGGDGFAWPDRRRMPANC